MNKRLNKALSIALNIMLLCSLCFQSVFADSALSVELELDDKTLTFSGTGDTSIKHVVAVKITAPDGSIFNINELKTNKDGSFSYSVTLSGDDQTGIYTATASVRGGGSAASKSDTVYYLSDASKEAVAGAVNAELVIPAEGYDTEEEAFEAAVSSAVSKLKDNAEMLGIGSVSDADMKNAAQVLLFKKSGSYDFDTIVTLCKRSKTVFGELADCDENTLTSFLITNSDIFFETEALAKKYSAFSGANKRIANGKVLAKAPFTDIAAVRKAAASAVKETEQSIVVKKLNVEASLAVNVVNVTGSGTLTAKKVVTLKITAPDGTIANINEIKAGDDGKFTYSALLDSNGASGTYTVSAFSRGIDEISEDTVFYLSGADRDSITYTANSSSSDVIASTLKSKKTLMGFSQMTDTELENAAIVLSEQKPAGGYEYSEVLTVISDTKTLTDKLAKADWLTLDTLLSENSDVLLKGVTEYDKYKKLDEAQRNKHCSNIMMNAPFNSISTFRTAFKNEFKESGGGGGAGGGSSSSGGSSSGGSGSGFASSGAFSAITDYSSQTAAPIYSFGDLDGYDWAKECIDELLKKGVISKADDGKFRPADNITREEFIKLLVCAFSIVDDEAKCEFSDVSEDSWYYVYVASAVKYGITNGRGDGSFGSGENITRQDMVTLALRTAQALGYTLSENAEELVFSDNAEIAEYARDAVSKMQKAGVVNGDETGCFRPEGYAVRAEAAKIISMLLVAVGK